METVGLTHRAEVPVHVLPYGEKRRLEIGIALATGPNVLLLDEPLAGMSPAERIATRALIREIGRSSRTLVIVEHDMDAIFELAERITVLYEGTAAGGWDAGGDPAQPGGAGRLSRGGCTSMSLLEIERDQHASTATATSCSMFRCDVEQQRGGGAAGPQWRRQDHDACALSWA